VGTFAFCSPIILLMGSERASTVRMKRDGKICALCGRSLPPPHTPGEKKCFKCAGGHHVYMYFFEQSGWSCQFLEADLKTPLPKKLTLKHPEKIFEIAEHGGAKLNLEGRQAIEHALRNGRGGIWLELSEEQYRKLTIP
jgi:hypothetical protein